jgi:pimeloyl-ACP methyl ester carboxylesterase
LIRSLFQPAPLRRSSVLALTERMNSITQVLSSLEYLAGEDDRRRGGLNNWDLIRHQFRTGSAAFDKLFDIAADRRVTRALHAARVGAGLGLLLPTKGRTRLLANLVLSGTSPLLYPRHVYGTDGTDQVSLLVQAATTVARAGDRNPQLVDACLWFISMQATLSYTAAGVAKVASPTWRSGEALTGIMRTRTYGDSHVWRMLRSYPRTGRAVSAGVLALESLFPLVYAARGRLARPMVFAAGAFHVANARVMGLGRFVPAFGSTYPALLYTAGPAVRRDTEGRVTERRDDLAPRLAAVGAVAAAGAALAARAGRRQQVLRRRDHQRRLSTTTRNVLAYRLTGPTDEGLPLIVAEHGLASTAEHWAWVTGAVSRRFPTLTYSRAGYGRSQYVANGPYRLETAVQDLVDLVDRVAGTRPVVLVGHSLGGYLALRAAPRLAGRVTGLCLIDSSHPAELKRSPRQARGAATLDNTLLLMSASLKLGLGALLPRPSWVDDLPEAVREYALAQYRDSGLWDAARREWKATRAEFLAYDGQPLRVEVPLLVVTAAATASGDPNHKELHDELAQQAPWSSQHVVTGATHDNLLTDGTTAQQVADLVVGFVDRLGPGRGAAVGAGGDSRDDR